jgi:sugar O-acyltransferase (sialic acid O-acetyltransferase NeuD family)
MALSLYVVGAGGFGREVLAYARDVERASQGRAFQIAGFLDDNASALDGRDVGAKVVAAVASMPAPRPDDRFVIAIGEPRIRKTMAARLRERGVAEEAFASIVHPTAYVAGQLGPGCVVAPFAFIGPGARLGAHVALNTYASVGHDAEVASYAVFSPYAVVNGAVQVGEGVFLGTHAAVVPGRQVGAWAKLGAGAVAHADLEAGMLALGNPAKGRVMFAPP